ncbi:MAG: hypothetical protein ACTHMD_01075 [Flavisolibacter sp.]
MKGKFLFSGFESKLQVKNHLKRNLLLVLVSTIRLAGKKIQHKLEVNKFGREAEKIF